jgi:hypothetical protein
MQINNSKEVRDIFYKQLIEFQTDLSNNNNNTNNNIYSSDIMERINNTQKLFVQLTNELESLKNHRLVLIKILNHYLINNRNILTDYKHKKMKKYT